VSPQLGGLHSYIRVNCEQVGAGKEASMVGFEPYIAYKYMTDISPERHGNLTAVSPR
jgi:hypothetical protein